MANPQYQRKLSETSRSSAISKIQIGKKQLLENGTLQDDDSYRDMLRAYGGVESSKDLDNAGLEKVLAHMRACGAVFTNHKKAGKKPKTMAKADDRQAMMKKIEALLTDMDLPWSFLTDKQKGKEDKPTKSMLHRLTGVEAIEWCPVEKLHFIIAALDKKAKNLSKAS
jgi:phage gp16-like protein